MLNKLSQTVTIMCIFVSIPYTALQTSTETWHCFISVADLKTICVDFLCITEPTSITQKTTYNVNVSLNLLGYFQTDRIIDKMYLNTETSLSIHFILSQSTPKLISNHRTIRLITLYMSLLFFACHTIDYRAKFDKCYLSLWQVNPKCLSVADKFCLTLSCDLRVLA